MDSTAHLLSAYGYFAVGGMIGLETLGLPLPGESVLIAASAYAATRHGLNIWGVVLASAAGAILGGGLAFWIGQRFGCALLSRYGPYVWITQRRIRLAEYLFHRHGGKIVFFGRFIVLLRSLASLLAGANGMEWRRFLLFNSLGAIAWATIYGFATFFFANEIKRVAPPVAFGLGAAAAIAIVAGLIWAKRHESELEKLADSNHAATAGR